MTRIFLNTLYLQTEGAYARIENDQVKVELDGEKLLSVPLHHLGAIVVFGTAFLTAPLMMRCAQDGRAVVYLDRAGRFRARVIGKTSGNVLLRKAVFDFANDDLSARAFARNVVAGKLQNSRQVLMRAARDSSGETAEDFVEASQRIAHAITRLPDAWTLDEIRGVEGMGAQAYFDVFDGLIKAQRTHFRFGERSRRPPRDRMNALLSFVYSLATSDCVSALECVGLDPQYGILHVLRPGRPALALDLVEEFRSVILDRLCLTMVNRKEIGSNDFDERAGGSVMLNDAGRKKVLVSYQKRKQIEVAHTMFVEKVPIGLLPHLQARLMARLFRGDIESYPPYMPI